LNNNVVFKRGSHKVLENKRYVERFSTDLKVRFGQHNYTDNGRVEDISMFGFFIKTPEVFPNGTLLKVQMLTPEQNFIKVEGVVQWSIGNGKDLHSAIKEHGMGIRISNFQEGKETYKRLCQGFWKKG
jgi:hypothetical protein